MEGREDTLVARYNILVKHSQKIEEELDGAVGRYNILLTCTRKQVEDTETELDKRTKQLAESTAHAAALNEAKRVLEEDLDQKDQQLDSVEGKYNQLLVTVREKGGRDSAKLLKEHRSQSPPTEDTPREYQQPVSGATSTTSSAQPSPAKGSNGHGQADSEPGEGAESLPTQTCAQSMWVMRHGEREDEVNEEWEATSDRPYDPPLTTKGRSQAYERGRVLARALLATKSENTCVVVSSPFLRCVQTSAEVIKGMQFVYGKHEKGGEEGGGGAPQVLHVDFGLGEMQTERQMKKCVPSYLSKSELEKVFRSVALQQGSQDQDLGELLHRWVGEDDADTGQKAPAYPETQEEAVQRYRGAFGRLLARFPDANIVCVTHGDGVASFMAHTGFTRSKDDVYDTPHCSYVSAISQTHQWTCGEIDPLIGFIDE